MFKIQYWAILFFNLWSQCLLAQHYNSTYVNDGVGGIGLCVGCRVDNGQHLGDNNPNNFALLRTAVNVGSYPYLNTTFNSTHSGGEYVGFIVQGVTQGLLSESLLAGLQVSTTKAGSLQEIASWGTQLKLSLLPGFTDLYKMEFCTTTDFDGLQLRWSALVGAANQLRIYEGYSAEVAPLPVQLGTLRAQREKQAAMLYWDTYTEQESSHFVVERASVPNVWEQIGQLPAAGTSNKRQQYHYFDPQVPSLQLYYRICQVDSDGTYCYSKVITLPASNTVAKDIVLRVHPTPAPGHYRLLLPFELEQPTAYQIFDAKGEVVQRGLLPAALQETTFWLPSWSRGSYLLVVLQDDQKLTARFFIL